MKYEPHDYQQYAIEYIRSHPVAAVLLDMGLGGMIGKGKVHLISSKR